METGATSVGYGIPRVDPKGRTRVLVGVVINQKPETIENSGCIIIALSLG
jgi:hypothetical protein